MSKKELRQLIRQRKRQFTQQELGELSLAVVGRLSAHKRMAEAQTVMLYCSLPDEVDTYGLIDTLYGEGKTVVLPVVTGEGEMELRVYHGADSLRRGAFDILEPVGERFTDYDSIDLAVIPGMAFDDSGQRLGRGKGYYDRFLVNLPHCYKIGMCFDFQRVEHVPCESTDIAVDEVI